MVAAPCSQWIACSPVRNWRRRGPLNKIVRHHNWNRGETRPHSGGVVRQAIWVLCCTCMCVAGPAYAKLFKCLSPAGELSVQSRVCPSEWKVENFDGDAELV